MTDSQDQGGYPAGCCPVCLVLGKWRLDRHGDAIATWACDPHLAWVLDSIQRDGEVTKVTAYRAGGIPA